VSEVGVACGGGEVELKGPVDARKGRKQGIEVGDN